MSGEAERVHATAVAVGTRAALLRGPSGAGKSDLALRCLSLAPSAIVAEPIRLVADDQVVLKQQGASIIASAPPTLIGKLEIRGVGILEIEAIPQAELVLVVDLIREDAIERYPDPWPFTGVLGLDVPLLRLSAFESSSALKLIAAILMAPQPRPASKA